MLRIIALPSNAVNKNRRKFFVCKKCGKKNWFTYSKPLSCQSTHCDQEFYNVVGLLNKSVDTMIHYYEKGIM